MNLNTKKYNYLIISDFNQYNQHKKYAKCNLHNIISIIKYKSDNCLGDKSDPVDLAAR